MKFSYTKKETYTQQDMDAILEQHNGYVSKSYKDFISPDDYAKVNEELTAFKSEKRNTRLSKLANEYVTGKKATALIRLTDISDDMDDKAIKSAFSKTIKEHDYLVDKVSPLNDGYTKKQEEEIVDKYKNL